MGADRTVSQDIQKRDDNNCGLVYGPEGAGETDWTRAEGPVLRFVYVTEREEVRER